MTLFLKCAQFRQTLLARILMGPPPLVPSFAPLSHMYASPGSLLYKKPSIWDKNSAFFAIFFRHWIKGFQWRFLYRNAREGCKYNAYHAEKVIFLWIFVKNPLIMILRSFFIVKSKPFQWTDWTSAEQSWFRSYFYDFWTQLAHFSRSICCNQRLASQTFNKVCQYRLMAAIEKKKKPGVVKNAFKLYDLL